MSRKLLAIPAALMCFGPALSILHIFSKWWGQPPSRYPDLHSPSATGLIMCGWVGLAVALDLVLQVLRRNRRPSPGAWLFAGVAAACVAGLGGLWILWLTPWRLWLLIAFAFEITGLFYLLYRCRRWCELGLLGLVFGTAGLALLVFTLGDVRATGDMAAWAKTQGRITDSGGSCPRGSKFWTRVLAYEYTVDGRQYTGRDDTWDSSRMRRGWGETLRWVCASYAWNHEVAVYYDRLHPERAVLRPGLSYATALFLRAALLSVLAGMALLVVSTQVKQANSPTPGVDGAAVAGSGRLGLSLASGDWLGRIAFAILGACALLTVTGIEPISPGAMQVASIDPVPANADGLCQRGLDLLREGAPQRARNNFTRALRLDPNEPAALYYNRGHALLKMGQVPQAVEDWKKAIELDWHMALHVYYVHRRLPSADPELEQIVTKAVLDHLGDLEEVSGYAVGAMAEPGTFYTVSLILSSRLGETDYLHMIDSGNPVIRAMGLISLARQDATRYQATIQSLYNDTADVNYVPEGCVVRRISIGTLARTIVEQPNTLGSWAPEKTKWMWDKSAGD